MAAAKPPKEREGLIVKGIVSWNRYFYGYKETKSGCKYYKSNNARFDKKERVSEAEYFEMAQKYRFVMG